MVNALNHTQSTSSKIKAKKMYVSTPINRVQEVETRLNKIFKEELDSVNFFNFFIASNRLYIDNPTYNANEVTTIATITIAYFSIIGFIARNLAPWA